MRTTSCFPFSSSHPSKTKFSHSFSSADESFMHCSMVKKLRLFLCLNLWRPTSKAFGHTEEFSFHLFNSPCIHSLWDLPGSRDIIPAIAWPLARQQAWERVTCQHVSLQSVPQSLPLPLVRCLLSHLKLLCVSHP